MQGHTTKVTAQPRRVEPIFDASGALRRQLPLRPGQKDASRQSQSDRD